MEAFGGAAAGRFRVSILLALAVALYAIGDRRLQADEGFLGPVGIQGGFRPAWEQPLQPMGTGPEAVGMIPADLPRASQPPAFLPGVVQAAYLPEPAPAPPPAETVPTAPLGEAPVDNSEVFLREETVLLSPGQVAVDYGAEYVSVERRSGGSLGRGNGGRQRTAPFAEVDGAAGRALWFDRSLANLPEPASRRRPIPGYGPVTRLLQ